MGPRRRGRPDLALAAALADLVALAESSPHLKASDTFLELQQELEEKIAYARRYYNQSAQEYNIRIQSMPAVIVARLCRFRPVAYFQAETAGRQMVQVRSTP